MQLIALFSWQVNALFSWEVIAVKYRNTMERPKKTQLAPLLFLFVVPLQRDINEVLNPGRVNA